jgi:hypothetical protein
MTVYRLFAIFIVLTPIVANTLFIGDIVTSLIYVPILALTLAFLVTYLDRKLEQFMAFKLDEYKKKVTRKQAIFTHRSGASIKVFYKVDNGI